MTPDPKWLEVLKASGWQTAAIAVACAVLFALVQVHVVPSPGPLPVFVVVAVGIGCACLTLASMVSALFKFIPPGAWLLHARKIALEKGNARKYIPYMTEKEKAVIGYLLAHNQKMFTAAADGGHATTLISRGIIVRALQSGQMFAAEDTPFAIPDHVWDVMHKHRDQFPTPSPDDPHPWRVNWMLR